MRTFLATLLAASLVAGGAQAASPKKKKKPYASHSQSQVSKKSGRTETQSEYSRPEDLPFGSTVWWRAMDREHRGGFAPDS